MQAPQTFVDLIGLWPTAEDLAADLGGIQGGTVRAWKRRGFIPPEYWSDVVSAAAKRDIQGVTLELLAGLASTQRPSKAGYRQEAVP